jgi:beta-galactosidase
LTRLSRHLSILAVSVLLPTSETASVAVASPRERISFNDDWRFQLGEAPDAGESIGYRALRPWILATGAGLINAGVAKPVRPEGNAGGEVSFVRADYHDAGWRALELPHDWAIEQPFSQDLPGETGKLPWQGVGWYRKTFSVPASDAGRQIALDLDGAMAYSAVWLNGQLVGGWPYGYSSYRLDLTPYVNFGGENKIAIRLENPPQSSRWYPGSGLYRNVWLVKSSATRVRHWGVFVTTPRVAADQALVNLDVAVEHLGSERSSLSLTAQLFELGADGQPGSAPVAEGQPWTVEIDPARAREASRSFTIAVSQPKLWDLATPQRYLARVSLLRDGVLLDVVDTLFGIRTAVFDAERGFLLNGRRVPLNGACMHHDLGALGAAVNARALERQIEILQEMGANAIRTSHNPPAPELLELCDRMGVLLLVEAFDCWRIGKQEAELQAADPFDRYHDYGRVFDDWHERDVRAMVRRDRNSPSVIGWSIGNEIREQWESDGWMVANRLAGIVREEDRTRPVTAGFNGEISGYNGFQTAVDLVGYNYKPWEYARLRHRHPHLPVYGAETASTLSSRGEYFFPVSDDKLEGRANFHVSSYDLSAAQWAFPPDREFLGLDEAPYAAGEFVWTGFDYLGEPTPYNADATNLMNFSDPEQRERMAAELERLGRIRVPSRSSYFGIVDLAGFPKDRYYLYQARWRPDLPMAHILPHWNWPERVGQVTPVHVYSSGDEAELFLNGRSLGRKQRAALQYRFRWDDVVHEPGEVKVVTYRQGSEWATAYRRTTGPAVGLALVADRSEIRSDGDDLAFVTLKVVDQSGEVVPRGGQRIRFSLSGSGSIAATDNGDPTDLETFSSPERRAFNGLALAIVRPARGQAGEIILRAEAEGLTAAEVRLKVR